MEPWLSKIRKQVQRLWPLAQPQLTPETLKIGTIVLERFKIIGILGQGGFGRTYKAEHLNRFGQQVALKEFAPDRRSIKDLTKANELFEREAKVLFQVNHPQIPKFLEHLIDRQGEYDRFFIVQEFISGQSYQFIWQNQYPSGLPVAEVKQLLLDLLPVLDYLHQQQPPIIHRDISPDNILRCNETRLPKLVDFGAVKVSLQSVTKNPHQTIVGKRGYAPPEQTLGKDPVSAASDLYSLGATAIVLLTGKNPEQLQSIYGVWQWRDAVTQPLDDRFAAVLDRMVLLRQSDRFQSAREVLTALQEDGAELNPVPTISGDQPLVSFQPGPTVNTSRTQVVGSPPPWRTWDSTSPVYRSLSKIPDPIVEFFKFFVTPEFLRFAKRQALWVGGLGILLCAPFFIGDALKQSGERPEPTPSENPTEPVAEATECDRFNRDYVEQEIEQTAPYLMSDIDALFYERYPELEGQTLEPGDPKMEDWCAIGNELLAKP